MLSVVGIGVPSKYFDFPVASLGRAWTVTLNRASRVRPHKTKKVRMRWSTGVRRPMANAATAGDTPKETCCCNIPISHYVPHIKLGTLYIQRSLACSTSGEATQGEGEVRHTKSARESNSWPIKLLFFLHLATFPSIKSKNKPKGINASAAQRLP
jgi:hypothetical protein